jgi:hypothetical protein
VTEWALSNAAPPGTGQGYEAMRAAMDDVDAKGNPAEDDPHCYEYRAHSCGLACRSFFEERRPSEHTGLQLVIVGNGVSE